MNKDYYDEWVLNEKSFLTRLGEICKKFGIADPDSIKFYSQQDEDKYIVQYILKEKIDDGVFLKIGACDGLLYSNTKTLEDYFNFSGILIEPQKNFFRNLTHNRPNCENYNVAISSFPDKYVSFTGNGAEAGIQKTANSVKNKDLD